MHTPGKVKFWQSRGQRFDPAILHILLNAFIGRMLLNLSGFHFHSDLNRQWICFP